MYLTLFVVFVCLSLLLVSLGLFKTEHSELALIGFFFLFILSFSLINDNITMKSGEFEKEVFVYGDNYSGYHWDYDFPNPSVDDVNLFHSNKTTTYLYETLDLGGNNNHVFGYWLAVGSMIGFAGVLWGLKRGDARK